MRLRLEPTDEAALVNRVLSDPWIAGRLKHDGRAPRYLPSPAVTYQAAYIENALAGVFITGRMSPYEIEAHIALYQHTVRGARKLAALFLDEAFNDPDVLRVSANVLACLPSAANFCRRVGFIDEGTKRAACLRDGIAVDIFQMGMTRQDWLAARIGIAY